MLKRVVQLVLMALLAVLSLSLSPSSAAAEEIDDPGVTDSVYRLYISVFDREPDAKGFEYWVDQYTSGMKLDDIAMYFVASAEWERTYGDVDDETYVQVLYSNVLKRNPDLKGGSYWLGELKAGLNREQMLTYFSESEELIKRTGTANPVAPYKAIPADSGEGRRIIYSGLQQRVWMVNANGTLHDTYLVSGRANTPLPGSYSVFSKSPVAWAGHDGITMNHMLRFTWGRTLAIGFHSIPRYGNGTPMQTEAELGTYQSAGCVRQSEAKAEALYNWAPVGTTVVVLD